MERYIIWDIDGTIVDSRGTVAESYLHALKCLDIEKDDPTRINPYKGKRGAFVYTYQHHLTGERLQVAVKAYSEHMRGKGLCLCSLYPGMKDLLQALIKKGAKMTIATARIKQDLESFLDRFGITGYFDCICASENSRMAADKPALVRECVDFMNVRPQDCVMVGDSIFDLLGGKQAGTRCIGVTYGFGTREALEKCEPDHIVDTVTELRTLLLGENG